MQTPPAIRNEGFSHPLRSRAIRCGDAETGSSRRIPILVQRPQSRDDDILFTMEESGGDKIKLGGAARPRHHSMHVLSQDMMFRVDHCPALFASRCFNS